MNHLRLIRNQRGREQNRSFLGTFLGDFLVVNLRTLIFV